MKKLIASVQKEFLLLMRDIEGVILMFFMPLCLVVVITLLQHRTFQNLEEIKIPIVIVDLDNDSLGIAFRTGIRNSRMFEVTEITDHDPNTLNEARRNVANGKYQIGILIPENTTSAIKNRAIGLVQKQLPLNITTLINQHDKQVVIMLFFDPITKMSFRDLARSKLNEFASQTETRIIFLTYSKAIDALTNQSSEIVFPKEPIITFKEDLVSEYTGGITPNSVQHNVPAWTLFGMFLICIPLAGNIIKERNDGCMARLKTIPVSYLGIMSGKSFVFIVICLIQASLIILVGIFLMPLFGLPKLVINNNWGALFTITLASAFAASGYGVAIGTIASTHIQASTFGSVSTVILAAIGGVWIPVMIMPDIMRRISDFSPLNWGIRGYYDVFLRNAGITEILPGALKLFTFYIICTAISLLFRKYSATR
jgi:ABC-2 type transport system permease protein